MNSQKYLFAIFCDDIRREEGNKLTYVGVYAGKLGVPAFPALLPRLCFVLSMTVPLDDMPSSLRFCIYKDEELIAQSEVPTDALKSAQSGTTNLSDDQMVRFFSYFQMSPAQFAQRSFLRARAICDGEEFRGGSLEVVDQREFAATPLG
jgi:hypothetical protein